MEKCALNNLQVTFHPYIVFRTIAFKKKIHLKNFFFAFPHYSGLLYLNHWDKLNAVWQDYHDVKVLNLKRSLCKIYFKKSGFISFDFGLKYDPDMFLTYYILKACNILSRYLMHICTVCRCWNIICTVVHLKIVFSVSEDSSELHLCGRWIHIFMLGQVFHFKWRLVKMRAAGLGLCHTFLCKAFLSVRAVARVLLSSFYVILFSWLWLGVTEWMPTFKSIIIWWSQSFIFQQINIFSKFSLNLAKNELKIMSFDYIITNYYNHIFFIS